MRACVIRRTAGLDQVEIAELRAPSARSPWVVRRQGGLERHMKEHDDRGPKLAPPLVQPLDGVDGRVGASDVDGGPTRSRGASARWLSFLAGRFVVLGVGTGLAWLLRPHPIPPGHPGHADPVTSQPRSATTSAASSTPPMLTQLTPHVTQRSGGTRGRDRPQPPATGGAGQVGSAAEVSGKLVELRGAELDPVILTEDQTLPLPVSRRGHRC